MIYSSLTKNYFLILVIILGAFSCQTKSDYPIPKNILNASIDSILRITSIEDEAIIPSNLYQPLIEWQSPQEYIYVNICSQNQKIEKLVSGNTWIPTREEFEPYLKDKEIYLFLHYQENGEYIRSPLIKISVSDFAFDENIIFRLIGPYFEPRKQNYIKMISIEDSKMNKTLTIKGACIGCHCYSNNVASFNIKQKTDRRFVYLKNDNIETIKKQRIIGHFSFFSEIVNNRYMLVVANTFGEINIKHDIKEPFDLMYKEGDIFVFDFLKEKLLPLPGASEIDYNEDMPSFNNDGNIIVFSRYQVTNDTIPEMELYTINFNDGKGGKAEKLIECNNNEHLYFAKFSPDNKWISFCKGDGKKGIFAKNTSNIFLLNQKTKKIKKLKLNRENSMDSWHQWSSNSKWLLFSSKRDSNQLTSLYLTYIDNKGNDNPTIKIYGNDSMKVNIPQLVPKDYILPEEKNINNFIQEIYSVENK